MGEMQKILVSKPKGKRPLKMDLKELVCEGMKQFHVAEETPVVGCCTHDNEPLQLHKSDYTCIYESYFND
jgi:hypothetical protein